MSDADTEKKLCQNSGQTSVNSGTVDCQAGPQSHKLGLVAFYDGSAPSNQPSWPYEKKNSGTNGKGAENVAKNILTLTKDEKVKVAGHLAKSIEGGEVVERVATKYSALRGVVVWYQCRILHRNAFAQALKVSDPGIDAKLCRAGSGGARNATNNAKCTDASNGGSKHGLSEFVNASLEGGAKNWPKATQASNHDNAKDVATGLVGLPKDEKSIVVGHLAKSIEGGEVVERIATKYSALRRVVVCYQS